MEPDPSQDVLGPKRRNYQFLQFVRDKKYAEALILGRQILKDAPNNPSVLKFVEFIEKNAKKLDDMVKQQEQYESAHSSDESDEEQEGEEEQKPSEDEKSSQEKDSNEEEQEQEQEEKPEKKIQLSTCTLNPIPHVCPRHHKLIIEAAAQGKV